MKTLGDIIQEINESAKEYKFGVTYEDNSFDFVTIKAKSIEEAKDKLIKQAEKRLKSGLFPGQKKIVKISFEESWDI